MAENINNAPFELISGPMTVYIAPVGTAMPLVHIDPPSPWEELGNNIDQSEAGLIVKSSQTINKFMGAGTSAPIAAFRPNEMLAVEFTLHDMRLETVRYAFNGNAVTQIAAATAVPGQRTMKMLRGQSVRQYALLVRGEKSPYGDAFNSQFEIYTCFHMGNPEPQFNKDGPAGVLFNFEALYNATEEDLALYVAQDADPT